MGRGIQNFIIIIVIVVVVIIIINYHIARGAPSPRPQCVGGNNQKITFITT